MVKDLMKKIIGIFVIVTLIGTLIGGCSKQTSETSDGISKPEKVYKWRLVTHQMTGTARYDDTIIPFVNMVKEASNGRLIIEPYGAGVLFPVSDSLDSVKNGIVEMGAVWNGYWAGKDPIFALAGSIPSDPINGFSEHFYRAEKLEPILSKAYEQYGVKSLGAFDFGPSEILMSAVSMNSLDDFKGKNIRTAGIGGEFYSKLGASTVSLSGPEIYTALQLGTVDAAEYNDWSVNMEMGFHEVTNYVIEPVLHTGPISDKHLIVNPKAWAELPDDLKAIVLACRDKARYLSASAYEVESKKSKQKYLDAGAKLIQLSEDDVKKSREIASELVKEYAKKSPACDEYVKGYAEVLNDLGYIQEAKNLGYRD